MVPEERQAAIAQRLSEAKGDYFVVFRGQYRELPVVDVPIDWPVYRAANGRLIAQLQRLQRGSGQSEQAFIAHQEDANVQQQLHDLLVDLARADAGPIYQELERLAQQTEPLLITADGVVVNGNRRLAAMRSLLATDPQAYADFQQVRVAVLPEEATTADIEYIESALQLAPETKLRYTWINRRLKLRRQRDELGLPVAQILEAYRLADAAEIDRELGELALAEAYLADYCGAPGEYERIEDAEDLFVGLHATLREPGLTEPELWRLAGFAMIHVRDRFKLQERFPFAPPEPAYAPGQALLALAVEEQLLTEEASRAKGRLDDQLREQLAAILHQRSEARRLTKELTDILVQIRMDHDEKQTPKRLLKHVRGARQLAERLEAERMPEQMRTELASEMAAIELHMQRVLRSDPDGGPAPISPGQRKWRKLRRDPHRFFADAKNPVLRVFKGLFSPRSGS